MCFPSLFYLPQEENEVTEFFVTLEKDPQQEDFLQGRMPGNPYSSNEPGIGPLMRDIKNKICQDCDLVALLEDDSGMEVANAHSSTPIGNRTFLLVLFSIGLPFFLTLCVCGFPL